MKVYAVEFVEELYVEFGCAEETYSCTKANVEAVLTNKSKDEVKAWVEKHSLAHIHAIIDPDFHGTFAWDDDDHYSATEGTDTDYVTYTYEIRTTELIE